MQELIKVNYKDDQPVVSGRDLHNALNIETKFNDWMPRMIDYGFEEGRDFNLLKNEQVRKEGYREVKREVIDYELSVDMAKQICMIQRTEKGKLCRQYFIDLEKAWNTPERIMERALIIAQKNIDILKNQVFELKPKAAFFDAVADSKTAIAMDQVAKVLGHIGRNKLFELLREKKVLMQNNLPYQKYIDCGYFRVIEQKWQKQNGEICISMKTLVYQRGIDYIRKIIGN